MPQDPEFMRLIINIIVLSTVVIYHTQKHAPVYHTKFHKSTLCLPIHITTGLMESFRYQIRAATSDQKDILPNELDVISSFIWSWTSFVLVKSLRRGHPSTTRPPYQTAAVLRPVISLASYVFEIPGFYKLSIRALDSFGYARLAIFLLTHTPYLEKVTSSDIYALAIPVASLLSIHGSRVPGATLAFGVITAYVAKLNRWVTRRSREMKEPDVFFNASAFEKWLVTTLLHLGFAELEELRDFSHSKALNAPVNDDYVPKRESLANGA
ncbi:hypothetical protein BO70DRAFT_290691 [Aspergillus heteromorphus CBS 117.55]|uniref:Uncharacterized protein n=1 Tax=Aspergillus heteromorphus CBS 117.55 TaxID=1448321 RepID=A0A317WAL6_9EURO|nr:uncharacterized protein BO70DRAFT_290691 [Aspergillus heteromorphus CBS 117.55]PWY83566.1 hypothetical protein BO70DRAFT_290691 [Aspergillus heteromorphus CBS 117.55]